MRRPIVDAALHVTVATSGPANNPAVASPASPLHTPFHDVSANIELLTTRPSPLLEQVHRQEDRVFFCGKL